MRILMLRIEDLMWSVKNWQLLCGRFDGKVEVQSCIFFHDCEEPLIYSSFITLSGKKENQSLCIEQTEKKFSLYIINGIKKQQIINGEQIETGSSLLHVMAQIYIGDIKDYHAKVKAINKQPDSKQVDWFCKAERLDSHLTHLPYILNTAPKHYTLTPNLIYPRLYDMTINHIQILLGVKLQQEKGIDIQRTTKGMINATVSIMKPFYSMFKKTVDLELKEDDKKKLLFNIVRAYHLTTIVYTQHNLINVTKNLSLIDKKNIDDLIFNLSLRILSGASIKNILWHSMPKNAENHPILERRTAVNDVREALKQLLIDTVENIVLPPTFTFNHYAYHRNFSLISQDSSPMSGFMVSPRFSPKPPSKQIPPHLLQRSKSAPIVLQTRPAEQQLIRPGLLFLDTDKLSIVPKAVALGPKPLERYIFLGAVAKVFVSDEPIYSGRTDAASP